VWLGSEPEKGQNALRASNSESLISAQGFKYYIEAEDPDVIVLTETKVVYTFCVLDALLNA
jgi:hypothetical protein